MIPCVKGFNSPDLRGVVSRDTGEKRIGRHVPVWGFKSPRSVFHTPAGDAYGHEGPQDHGGVCLPVIFKGPARGFRRTPLPSVASSAMWRP